MPQVRLVGSGTGTPSPAQGSRVKSPQPGECAAQAPNPPYPHTPLCPSSPGPSASARHYSQSLTRAWAGHLPAPNARFWSQGPGACCSSGCSWPRPPVPFCSFQAHAPTWPGFWAPGALGKKLSPPQLWVIAFGAQGSQRLFSWELSVAVVRIRKFQRCQALCG